MSNIVADFNTATVMAAPVASSDIPQIHKIILELFIRTNVFLSSFKSPSSLWGDERLHFSLSLSLRENIRDSKSNK